MYQVIMESLGGSVKHYTLKPECQWECDLEAMESMIDSRTRAILINNPSNPCGSNFSLSHLSDIVAVARRHRLPIISDEIYGAVVYGGEAFHPVQTVRGDVPVIAVGGLAKEFVVPGWRLGWVVVHDRSGSLAEVRTGLRNLSQLVLGACSLIQLALPRVLTPRPGSRDAALLQGFYDHYLGLLADNALLCERLSAAVPALRIVRPTGAMYAMLEVDFGLLEGLTDDRDFAELLLQEENIALLPGQCFGMTRFVRLVTCSPAEVLVEAFARLEQFCRRHARTSAYGGVA